MKPLGRMMDHLWLVKRMGRSAQVDFVSAHADGTLSQQDWADIVRTCQGCSWAPRCDEWMTKNEGRACAPSTCLNRARFEELKRRQAEAA